MLNGQSSQYLESCYTEIAIGLGNLRSKWESLFAESPADPKLAEVNDKYVIPTLENGVKLLGAIQEYKAHLKEVSEASGARL